MTQAAPLPRHASTTWVVVADHAHARAYVRQPRNMIVSRDARTADEVLTWSLEPLPDFTLESMGDYRLPLEVADRLNHAFAERRFQGVVIIAPPAWLGQMRPHLTQALRAAVLLELDKDLTKLPQARLLQRINDLLPSREGVPF